MDKMACVDKEVSMEKEECMNREICMSKQEWCRKMMDESVAIILVGGRSRRMNFQDKMHLKIGEDSFLEIIMKKLSFFREIAISASKTQVQKLELETLQEQVEKKVYVIEDKFYDVGPMGGMYSVMSEIKAEYFFIVSCDMPYIEREIIEELYSYLQEGDDAVIAVTHGKIQPLFSIYSSRIKEIVLEQIEKEQYRVLDFYDMVQTRYVELDDKGSLRNINTLEEYERT